jgi:hypothetical protein
MQKGYAALKEADREADRAKASAAEAEGYDRPDRVGKRIATNEAELGRWRRSLARTERAHERGDHTSASSAWVESARARIAELEDKLRRDREALAASPAGQYSRETVRPGDMVKYRHGWDLVIKSNPKTWTSGNQFRLTYPYSEIREHRPATVESLTKLLTGDLPADIQAALRKALREKEVNA